MAHDPSLNATAKSTSIVQLGVMEQFVIGIVSGMLASLQVSVVQWILYVVVVPSMVLEVYEILVLSRDKTVDPQELRLKRKLRQQQFGHGAITGSTVSKVMVALLLHTSSLSFIAIKLILHLAMIVCWKTLWEMEPILSASKSTTTLASLFLQQQQQQQQQPTKISPKKAKRRKRRNGYSLV